MRSSPIDPTKLLIAGAGTADFSLIDNLKKSKKTRYLDFEFQCRKNFFFQFTFFNEKFFKKIIDKLSLAKYKKV